MNVGLAYRNSSFLGLGGNISNFGWFGLNCPDDYKVNANSVPDYDVWGPDGCHWSASDWVNWHKAMVTAFGKPTADDKWSTAYDKSTYGSTEIGYSTGDPDFKSYVIGQGLDKKSSILSKVYKAEVAVNALGEPIRNVGEAVNNATQATAAATDATTTVITWIPWIVLGASLLLAALIWKKQSVNLL